MNDTQRQRLQSLQNMPERDANEDLEMNRLLDLESRNQELEDLKAEGASQEELQTAEKNLKAAEEALNGGSQNSGNAMGEEETL